MSSRVLGSEEKKWPLRDTKYQIFRSFHYGIGSSGAIANLRRNLQCLHVNNISPSGQYLLFLSRNYSPLEIVILSRPENRFHHLVPPRPGKKVDLKPTTRCHPALKVVHGKQRKRLSRSVACVFLTRENLGQKYDSGFAC